MFSNYLQDSFYEYENDSYKSYNLFIYPDEEEKLFKQIDSIKTNG